MKRLLFCTLLLLFLAKLASCKRYDASLANYELIQGKWMLIDVSKDAFDSIEVNYATERTYLSFENDKCIQYMPDLEDTSYFQYQIKGYDMALYKDSILINILKIDILTEDTLTLSHENNDLWKYVRINKKAEN